MTDVDVFVIGGGPAGLAAAIAASRQGLGAVVVDGNRPPIDKACGEGLMPDSRFQGARLGVDLPDSVGFEFRGIRFDGAGRSVGADFPKGRGIGVRRTVLHQALIEAAERAGVELRWDPRSPTSKESERGGLSAPMVPHHGYGAGRDWVHARGIRGDLPAGNTLRSRHGPITWRSTGAKPARSM